MNLKTLFFKSTACQGCNKKISKNYLCNNCADKVTELVFQKEKYGIEPSSDNSKINLLASMTIKDRDFHSKLV